MTRIIKWASVLICVAVVVSESGTWARQQGKVSPTNRFERRHKSFGTAQIRPPQPEGVRRMARQRRIILNDDGFYGPREVQSLGQDPEECLSLRFNSSVGTQVDTYCLCVGATSGVPLGEAMPPCPGYALEAFHCPDTDVQTARMIGQSIEAYIVAAHKAGMEIFASLRMNDCHDANVVTSGFTGLTYPLKVERPDLLLGEDYAGREYGHLFEGEGTKGSTGYPSNSIMSWFFCGLDWAKEEVRQHFLDFILSYCREYDYDGVELDYVRHTMFFKFGEERENMDKMTEFVRRVRQGLDEIGRERGRRYLLATRVPSTPAMARRAGLDVERWLAEGLLDLLVVGGGSFAHTARLQEFIDMAHRYGVPAYPCINHFQDPISMRSRASGFWGLGGDGVYIFNYFGVPEGSEKQQCLQQMGDPDILVGFDKHYQPDYGFSWFPYGHECGPGQFPVWLIEGTPIQLVVGDDVQKAAHEGLLDEMRLQVQVSNMDESEGITIMINDVPVSVADMERVAPDSFEALVQAPPLRRGINEIVVLPGLNSVARIPNTIQGEAKFVSTVEGLDLSVRYKHE